MVTTTAKLTTLQIALLGTVLCGAISKIHNGECTDEFSLSADDYSELILMQTRSVLFGPGEGRTAIRNDTFISQNRHVFGLDFCCGGKKNKKDKNHKKCRKEQKKRVKRHEKAYKNSGYSDMAVFGSAVCQMKFEVNKDVNRVPEEILEVKCSCDLPLNSKSRKHVCKELYQYIPVFRRSGCEGTGVFRYERDTERIAVACILVKEPRTRKQKKPKIRSKK